MPIYKWPDAKKRFQEAEVVSEGLYGQPVITHCCRCIGLGEPTTVSPTAAISNAVANAFGVRVPFLPLTPDRVLAALETTEGARI